MTLKSILKSLLRRVVFALAIGALLFAIQPLVTRVPWLHATIVILLFLFAWEYIV
ncbi:MAG: hypothetical protein BWY10_00858 [Chloroflexi bacterium ADurb.Bin180]|nr:MAG: hypothetical protein BWY10_00858 [Chloroflexi bacterium ADurb.Bin180]